MCRSRRWPKRPSTPTGRWWWHCAAAIFAKASRASWRNGRRGLRGSEEGAPARLRPLGYAGHASLSFITWLRHAKPEGRSVVYGEVDFIGHSSSSPCGLRRARFAFVHHVAAPREARRAKRGGARRDRTADLVIANDALSQLSYGPLPR